MFILKQNQIAWLRTEEPLQSGLSSQSSLFPVLSTWKTLSDETCLLSSACLCHHTTHGDTAKKHCPLSLFSSHEDLGLSLAGWLSFFGVSSHAPKCGGFDSQSGHIPRLRIRSPIRVHMEAADQCFSHQCFLMGSQE